MPVGRGLGLGMHGGKGAPFGAAVLLDGESDGLGLDFTFHGSRVGDAQVKDTSTPANVFRGAPSDLLTYTSPSVKMCMQSDGTLKHGAHNLAFTSDDIEGGQWNEVSNGDGSITYSASSVWSGHDAATCVNDGTDDQFYLSDNIGNAVTGFTYIASITLESVSNIDTILLNDVLTVATVGQTSVDVVVDGVSTGETNLGQTLETFGITTSGSHRIEYIFTATNGNGIVMRFGIGASGAGRAGVVVVSAPSVRIYPTELGDAGYFANSGTSATYQLPYEWDTSGNSLGILAEERRTNICLNSLDATADVGTNSGATITSDEVADPFGGSDGDEIAISANGYRYWRSNSPADGTWSGSIFARADSNLTIGFRIVPSDGSPSASELIAVTTEWQRFDIQLTISGEVNLEFGFDVRNPITGDDGAAKTIYVCQRQLELGSFPTSPIITGSATVTRAEDQITLALSATPLPDMTGASDVISAYTNAELPQTGNSGVWQLDDGSENDRYLHYATSATAMRLLGSTTDAGGATCVASITSLTAGQDIISSVRMAEDDCAFSLFGKTQATDTDVDVKGSGLTTLRIGGGVSGSLLANSHIKQLVLVPADWDNATLETKVGN